jgi:hypothetical protein
MVFTIAQPIPRPFTKLYLTDKSRKFHSFTFRSRQTRKERRTSKRNPNNEAQERDRINQGESHEPCTAAFGVPAIHLP